MSPWLYLRFLFLPALAVAGSLMGNWWTFSIPVICFVVHPIINLLSGKKPSDYEDEHREYDRKLYRLIPLIFAPILVALTAWSVGQSNHNSTIEFTGMVMSVGIVNGILGFTLAHEFIHRHSRIEKIAGHILLLQNSYSYYSIEHIGGHHLYACTEKDPHTARIGESFYRFLPRALAFTFINAWEIESNRLKRRNKKTMSWSNRMLLLVLLQAICYSLIIPFGWKSFLFFMLQGVVSILLLNITGYLQHYGLARKQVGGDQFERISAHHAWSSPQTKDGLNLFQVGKHADHHMHPSHSYDQLVHHHDSPEQPTGYSGMMWLALVPPLWFRIMNKRIFLFTDKTFQHETAKAS
jgi:alkane 1-monooxygenase